MIDPQQYSSKRGKRLEHRPRRSGVSGRCLAGIFWLFVFGAFLAVPAPAGDLSVVPLFNGERSDMINLWGGPFGLGSGATFAKQSAVVNTGNAAYQLNVGTINSG